MHAPHEIPRPEAERERGWWFSKPERRYNALDKTDTCIGYSESLQMVKERFALDGPFDGILGFSQGAAFASLLCTLQNDPTVTGIDFKFAIVMAGFKSLVTPHSALYSNPINCPSFHSIGSTDAVIPTQSSEDLLDTFVDGVPYRHDGGHYIPSSPHLRTALVEFLTPFLK